MIPTHYTRPASVLAAAGLAIALALPAHAKLTDAEAAKLGADLTPIGAEKAGNQDGTIPAWSGGLTSPRIVILRARSGAASNSACARSSTAR